MDAGVLTMKMQHLACGLVFVAACGKPGHEVAPPKKGGPPTHVVFGKAMYLDGDARSFNSRGIGDLTPLSIFTSLETLDLSNNPIKDIGPLRGLKKLKSLDISNTYVRDLSPLFEHEALEHLNVKATMVVSLEGLPESLRLLQVDAELGPAELERFKRAHPQCEVRFSDGATRRAGEVGPIGDAKVVRY